MSKAILRAAPMQYTAEKLHSCATDVVPASALSGHASAGSHNGIEIVLDLFRGEHELLKQCMLHGSDDTVIAEYLEILCLVGVQLAQYQATTGFETGSALTDLPQRFADVSEVLISRPQLDQGRRGSVLLSMKLLKLAWLAHLLKPALTDPSWTLLLANTDDSAVVDTMEQLQPVLCVLPLNLSWDFLVCLLTSLNAGRSRVEACVYRTTLDVVVQAQPSEVRDCNNLVSVLSELDLAGSIQASLAPVELQSSLGLWGHVLASRYLQEHRWTAELLDEVQTWLHLSMESMKDDNVSNALQLGKTHY